jgi:two-component system OmpR family sensor kinase
MAQENYHDEPRQDRLLTTLQRVLELPVIDLNETLHQAAQLVTQALGAEKVDVFLYDPPTESLIALGTSETSLGKKEQAIGLDRLPLADRGRVVDVYLSGKPYLTGQVQDDPNELKEIKEELEIKSEMIIPLSVSDERRGALLASSLRANAFTEQDLRFFEAITRWIGVTIHRTELVEQHMNHVRELERQIAAEEILTVMAHDLRNYLTPLKVRLDLLERRALRDAQEPYAHELKLAQQTLMRLDRLVQNLLDIARIKHGLFSLNLQSVNLVELVEELVPIWKMPHHPIVIQAPAMLTIRSDHDRLQQALENLLSNATTHAFPDTFVQVVIAQEVRNERLWAIVTISNQGPGIPQDLLASLFQPFVKGAQSQGLGLGLYVTQRIAQAHQGTLTVQTEAGAMTHFLLALPVDPA